MRKRRLHVTIRALAFVWAAIAASTTIARPPNPDPPYQRFFDAWGFTASSWPAWVVPGSLAQGKALAVVRLNGEGIPDPSFNGTGLVRIAIWGYAESAWTATRQSDGKYLIGGNAADPADKDKPWAARCPPECTNRPVLVRLNTDGSLDRSFNGDGTLVLDVYHTDGVYGFLNRIDLQADGKVVIVDFDGIAVARINPDGTLDRSFVVPGKTVQVVRKERYGPGLISAGFTGSWYDPAQNGHGFALQVLPGDPMRLLASWFAFAPQGGQIWITGIGSVIGKEAIVQSYRMVGSGGRFPPSFDAAQVHAEPWGTLTFTFSDCSHGQVGWSSTVPGYSGGRMNIERLTLPAGLTCDVDGSGRAGDTEGVPR